MESPLYEQIQAFVSTIINAASRNAEGRAAMRNAASRLIAWLDSVEGQNESTPKVSYSEQAEAASENPASLVSSSESPAPQAKLFMPRAVSLIAT